MAVALAGGAGAWAVATQTEPAAPEAAAFDNVNDDRVKVNALLESGLVQARYQDVPRAKATFEHVLELDPANTLAWYNLGVLAQGGGHRADALKAYDAALKTDAAYPPALFNKALLLEDDRPEEALKLLRRAVAADPRASTAHFHIGGALAREGDEEGAGDAYRRAVELDPALRSHVPESFRDALAPAPSPEEGADAAENSETPDGQP
ncbi:tetratricopeptide repeat protein [Streptomyces sp. NPDC002490]|uniref:tetratricopeptide repeat protein n=1 Tax=Streptomyces sp. NPDC002490 TaxID=3154416 RepID=UPI0033239733